MIKILVVQRESLVARGVPSLSVSARVIELLDYLKYTNEIDFFSISEKDLLIERAVKMVDFVFFSKHNSLEALEIVRYAKKYNKKTIYDVDDWIFSFPKYSAGNKHNKKIDIIKEILENVNFVTVANDMILEKIKTFHNNPIFIPNGIYIEKYLTSDKYKKLLLSKRKKKIIFTNADLLKVDKNKGVIINILQEFFTLNPDFILDFYGDPFPEMFSMPFLHFTNRISYEDYMFSLINGEYLFSITPLGSIEECEDNLFFNKCKNPFKYFNYGTALIPGIYSDAYIYKNVISHKNTGLLIQNNHDDWINSMNEFVNNNDLRKNIAKNAYDDIDSNHHIRIAAKIFKEKILC